VTADGPDPSGLRLADIHQCFEGAVPAVVATSSAAGTPNVTYLSRVRMVDDHRVALSNQFFSKTARNLAENPRANLLLIDPVTYDEYRLALAYERTERRGPVFERLRTDVDTLAALSGMEDVFRLRAADIYRVVSLERVVGGAAGDLGGTGNAGSGQGDDPVAALADLAGRLGRSADLDQLVGLAVDGLADLLGYEHCLLLLADESNTSLYTVAGHGYPDGGIGSEVRVGTGVIGLAAERGSVVRVGNIRQMDKYSRTVQRRSDAVVEATGVIALPGLANAGSQLAVPALAFGQVVGVLFVERDRPVAFSHRDETVLGVMAALIGAAVEAERGRAAPREAASPARPLSLAAPGSVTQVRFFPADGSTFLDGEYLIKGVAGRILWSLLCQFDADGRVDFTNREVRLDPSLDLPEYRDNLESRLILLRRRLDDREAPIRLQTVGRGRFRLLVDTTLRLERVDP
jgi:predicted pyridoxine 5'-phosphate oxidase superfamily flavin-nucleotide-binding protein